MSREVVRRVVQRNLDQAYLCLLRQRPVGSRWNAGVVRFVIAADGRVRRARAEPSADRSIMACLARAARRWLYPRPRGGKVTVRLPLVYRR